MQGLAQRVRMAGGAGHPVQSSHERREPGQAAARRRSRRATSCWNRHLQERAWLRSNRQLGCPWGISSRAFRRYTADMTQDSELERARLRTCTGRPCTCGNVRKETNPATVNPWLDEGTIIQYPRRLLAEVRCYCAKLGQPKEALIRASPSLVSGSILRRLCPPDETRFEKARRT
jgi:hypothetical protein